MRLADWQDRYLLQATWTKNLRNYILAQVGARAEDPILDVGCGTGALFGDYEQRHLSATGMDVDFQRCEWAASNSAQTRVVNGNAFSLPFAADSFKLTACHYLLLWLKNPELAIKEMRRVTSPGGWVIAFAEPDYEARIDHPDIFRQIGRFQNHSLEFQGVNLSMGRQLGAIFHQSALESVRIGLLAGQWMEPNTETFSAEWDMIAYDLGGMVPIAEILELKQKAEKAWLSGLGTVFIPTFYAYGQVPSNL